MVDMYMYISEPKVTQLTDQSPALFSGITAKLDFKIPFVSGGISGENNPSTVVKLRRLIPKLQSQYNIRPFNEIVETQSSPVFVSFEGAAARHIETGYFLLALESDRVALLLAGSATNVMGGENVKAKISPSVDPVRAILGASRRYGDESDELGESPGLSYVWQALMAASIRARMRLPNVEGIAVFSAMCKASKWQMERVERGHIDVLVIGTPLYVKQVGTGQ